MYHIPDTFLHYALFYFHVQLPAHLPVLPFRRTVEVATHLFFFIPVLKLAWNGGNLHVEYH